MKKTPSVNLFSPDGNKFEALTCDDMLSLFEPVLDFISEELSQLQENELSIPIFNDRKDVKSVINMLTRSVIIPLISSHSLLEQKLRSRFGPRRWDNIIPLVVNRAFHCWKCETSNNITKHARLTIKTLAHSEKLPFVFKILSTNERIERDMLQSHCLLYMKDATFNDVSVLSKEVSKRVDDIRYQPFSYHKNFLSNPLDILKYSPESIKGHYWLFLMHIQEHGNDEAKQALLYRVCSDTFLSQLFYWSSTVQSSYFDIFYISRELRQTVKLFQHLVNIWSLFFQQRIDLPTQCPMESDNYVILPLDHRCRKVNSVQILKILGGKSKPFLLQFNYESSENRSSKVIFKIGDDLRKDAFVWILSQTFNSLWDNDSSLTLRPFIHTYKCIPLFSKPTPVGIIEFIENSESAETFPWTSIQECDHEIFVRSLAGSCIAAWVLGMRDRHEGNCLVMDKRIFFNIDFGHLFDTSTAIGIDAPRMGLPIKLIEMLINRRLWDLFENILLNGFAVIYYNGEIIQSICGTLFDKIPGCGQKRIRKFIADSLMLSKTVQQAQDELRYQLGSRRNDFLNRAKKIMHTFGMIRAVPEPVNLQNFQLVYQCKKQRSFKPIQKSPSSSPTLMPSFNTSPLPAIKTIPRPVRGLSPTPKFQSSLSSPRRREARSIGSFNDKLRLLIEMIKNREIPNTHFHNALTEYKKYRHNWNINEQIACNPPLEIKCSLFYYACQHGRTDYVLSLMQQPGIRIDGEQSSTGNSPLHACCLYQHKDLLILLLYAGAFPGHRNTDAQLPDCTITEQSVDDSMNLIWHTYSVGGLELFKQFYRDYVIEECKSTVGVLLALSEVKLVEYWPKSHYDLPVEVQLTIREIFCIIKKVFPDEQKKIRSHIAKTIILISQVKN